MTGFLADRVTALATGLCCVLVLVALAMIVGPVVAEGIPALSWSFLSSGPTHDLARGGIFPALCGTLVTTVLMTCAAVPVGLATAVYLAELSPPHSRFASILRESVYSLAAVPSIVFGMFGLAFFVRFLGMEMDASLGQQERVVWGKPCVLWASLTLALLTLPVVIVACEQALLSVPKRLRDASLGLGATRLQTITRVVLPHARRGIYTGIILAISRASGEVAPILLTGAAAFAPRAPVDLHAGFMHLGVHVFTLATQAPDVDAARPALFGSVLVLLALTATLNLVAIVLRDRARRSADR